MKFSILVPVYNVEKYLRQCVESVLNQDFCDFELVLVNDGSTDSSPLICQEYSAKDNRVKYFSKDNEGLLLTRRYSIREASGEYVLFLDSDDYWLPGILTRLNDAIEESKADMILYRFKRVGEDGSLLYEDKDVFPDKTLFQEKDKDEFIKEFVSSSRLNTMWTKCVKRSIIDADTDYSRFRNMYGEDFLQSVALIKNASSIYYINDILYDYRLSVNGSGRNFKLEYITDYEIVREYVYSFIQQMNVSQDTRHRFLQRYMEGIMSYMNSVPRSSKNFSEFKDVCEKVRCFPLYRKASEMINGKYLNKDGKGNYLLFKHGLYFLLYIKTSLRNRIRTFVKICKVGKK